MKWQKFSFGQGGGGLPLSLGRSQHPGADVRSKHPHGHHSASCSCCFAFHPSWVSGLCGSSFCSSTLVWASLPWECPPHAPPMEDHITLQIHLGLCHFLMARQLALSGILVSWMLLGNQPLAPLWNSHLEFCSDIGLFVRAQLHFGCLLIWDTQRLYLSLQSQAGE